jgi:hypothetical protein
MENVLLSLQIWIMITEVFDIKYMLPRTYIKKGTYKQNKLENVTPFSPKYLLQILKICTRKFD